MSWLSSMGTISIHLLYGDRRLFILLWIFAFWPKKTIGANCRKAFLEKHAQKSPYLDGKKSHVLPYLDYQFVLGSCHIWAGFLLYCLTSSQIWLITYDTLANDGQSTYLPKLKKKTLGIDGWTQGKTLRQFGIWLQICKVRKNHHSRYLGDFGTIYTIFGMFTLTLKYLF
jgi:hypothetical protein